MTPENSGGKDEALRSKEAAEAKIRCNDYTSARDLVLEALKAYPRLDHASAMLLVCDVLCASEIELPNCGVDWYWVLQLAPSDEPAAIEAQHRKLIASLEPIKGEFPGTESAIQCITDAFSVLSDPVKRAALDSKRNGVRNVFEADDPLDGNAGNEAAVEVAVEGSDLDTPSSSRVKRNGDGNNSRVAEEHDDERRKKMKAEVAGEEPNCSDEASSVNVTDRSGSNPGIQNQKPKWSPKDFSAEQIWAVYDGPHGMPRSYVKINNVASQTEVRATFLDPHPWIDEEIQWVEESLPLVCGIFRAGKETANLEMCRFSHIVKCDRSAKKSFFRIFPQKGEVWAMYKNWDINWKSSDLFRYQCRMVEILSDFSEETGTTVRNLIEVNGRLTFFQRQCHEGFQLTRQLSRLDMLSFSHRVPAFTVIGIKDSEIPKGSLHLEPDALPPKFAN